ncbi:unnamed protein product [Leptidea sinapis]|uniref:RRM domain-containing protein n=1 Tax=Leptidea sinapis TaxID=189913 RepID=A0A5E4QRH6_9NEOP|nr:unnamed protein product [Leptidea sinapis]
MELLLESSRNQAETINTISENISSMKEKLQEVNTAMDLLMAENKNIKEQIVALSDTVTINKGSIKSLQNDLAQLKLNTNLSSTSTFPSQATYDNLMYEFNERIERKKNVVIVGIPEKNFENVEERRENDRREIEKITKTIYPGCPKAVRVQRLGKYNASKARPLKICFSTSETAIAILCNKNNIKIDGVRIHSDQTIQQQKEMKNLVLELKNRQEKGENNLIIPRK